MPGRSVYIETFGCQMNELDSELVTGALRTLGYQFVSDPDAAGIVLYNTCSVREHAEQKVWSRLGELGLRKQEEPGLVIGVLGCLAERDGVDLIRRMPQVDVLCGPGELDKLPALLDNAVRTRESLAADDTGHRGPETPAKVPLRSARQVALQGSSSRRSATLAAAEDSLELLDLSRAISPIDADPDRPRSSAYVRITRGCNKFCTYCVVPFTRGAEVHRPPEHIIDECKKLADAGVIEVTLLGQTVNHYRFEHGAAVTVNGVMQPQKGRSYAGGHRRDPYAGNGTTTFADLLARIHDQVPAIKRLRFVTSYPRDFGDDVLQAMRDHPRICRYLHVPAQSGSDRILGLMNRGYSASEYLEFIARARQYLDQPEIGRPLMLSGDFIVGFPTETDEDFDATVSMLRAARYKNAFIFKYSPRPGTVAISKFSDDVPEAIKRTRNNRLLAEQSAISESVGRAQVGHQFDVLVEGFSRLQRKSNRRAAGGVIALTVGGAPADSPGSQWAQEPAATPVPETAQFSGRTDGDLIVFFDAPADRKNMIGSIVRIEIRDARALGLFGALIKA